MTGLKIVLGLLACVLHASAYETATGGDSYIIDGHNANINSHGLCHCVPSQRTNTCVVALYWVIVGSVLPQNAYEEHHYSLRLSSLHLVLIHGPMVTYTM